MAHHNARLDEGEEEESEVTREAQAGRGGPVAPPWGGPVPPPTTPTKFTVKWLYVISVRNYSAILTKLLERTLKNFLEAVEQFFFCESGATYKICSREC